MKTTIMIAKATHLDSYRIEFIFNDNTKRVIDFEKFLTTSRLPDVKKYLQKKAFKNFKLENGDIMWGDYEMLFPIHDLYTGDISKGDKSKSIGAA